MTRRKAKEKEPLPRLMAGESLIDTHCHLDMKPYGHDLDAVLTRAATNGVSRIVTVGIDLASSRRAVALAGRYHGVYATVGVHPHHVEELTDDAYGALAGLARQREVVAFGEIGLDYAKMYAPAGLQRQHFDRQVELAKSLGLPLVIHDREAHADCLAILRRHAPFPAGGVMHCFSGDMALAEQVLELGFYISIPGIVTFRNAPALQQVAADSPLDRLLLETDGPFLAPVPHRGKRNEPLYTLYTAQKVAALRGLSLAAVAHATTANGCRLFGGLDDQGLTSV